MSDFEKLLEVTGAGDEEISKFPICYNFLELQKPRDYAVSKIFKYSKSTTFGTDKYLLMKFHRPISKIFLPKIQK